MVGLLVDLGIPDGQTVDRYRGGEGMLKRVLEDVRKYAFTGYVKLVFELNADKGEGIILFNSGEPLISIYTFKKAGASHAERYYKGGKAVEFIWEDSLLPDATISLHSRVPVSDIEQSNLDAKITRVELMPPSTLSSPRNAEEIKKLAGRMDEVASQIKDWAKEGYNVSNLIRLYLTDQQAAARSIPYFESNIQRLEGLEEVLRFLDTVGYEREAESLFRRMRDPERLLDVEAELESLRRRIEGYEETEAEEQIQHDLERKKVDEKIDGVYDLILQYHKKQARPGEERRCELCGGLLDDKGACPTCPVRQTPSHHGRTLNPRFTFATFVAGPNNRFAEAAARSTAETPGKSYNPLFIYSRSGMGKTHLLHAIGNQILKNYPEKKVLLSPTEVFESELIEALAANRLEEVRTIYRGADVLLIDDVQFLAGKERTQEELFHTFNSIIEKGGQIVLTSDRQPKEIPSLSERLVTRFESGLIADIQSPDLETRVAILDKRIKTEDLQVPRDVLAFIAEVCKDNVRQLEGGLNRVVAFSSLMKSTIRLELAHEILRLESKQQKAPSQKIELVDGHSYLLEEEKPDTGHRLLAFKVREGYSGLGIIRSNPKLLRGKMGSANAHLLWLTDHESKDEKTVSPTLERIIAIIEEFMTENKRSIILLDDIQYLIGNTSFDGVIRFLRMLIDQVSEKEAIFLLSVNPEALKVQERSILEREMEVIRASESN
jgi:chromosomal replication initiator protein DnaA